MIKYTIIGLVALTQVANASWVEPYYREDGTYVSGYNHYWGNEGWSTHASTSGGHRGIVHNYVDGTFPELRVETYWIPPCICTVSNVPCWHTAPLKLKTMSEDEKVVYNDSRFDWYRKTAASGNRYAIYELANCYFKGIGTKQDIAAGLKWISLLQKEPYQDSVAVYNSYQAEKSNFTINQINK